MRDFELINVTKSTAEAERIIFKVLIDGNLSNYLLLDNTYTEENKLSNIHRHCYVFPNVNVRRGDYVMLYTGEGSNGAYTNNSKTTTHVFYWGFDNEVSIWNDYADKVYIIRISDFQSFTV